MRKILFIILIALIPIGMSACGKNEEEITNDALEYLNNNYSHFSDTFTPVRIQPKNWAGDYDSIFFESKNYENQLIEVRRMKVKPEGEFKLAKYIFTDNYFSLYMQEDTEKYFENIIQPILGNDIVVRVDYPIHFPKDLESNATFQEFLNHEGYIVELYVFGDDISVITERQKYESIINTLQSAGVTAFVDFHKVNTNDLHLFKEGNINEVLLEKNTIIKEKKSYFVSKTEVKDY